MRVHNFLGFPSLQEVECSGGSIETDADILSLTLYKVPTNVLLANVKTFKNTCKTFSEFSSCTIVSGDSRKSTVKTLVADLEEGGRTMLGCNVTVVQENGHPRVYSWSILVHRKSKWKYLCVPFSEVLLVMSVTLLQVYVSLTYRLAA